MIRLRIDFSEGEELDEETQAHIDCLFLYDYSIYSL